MNLLDRLGTGQGEEVVVAQERRFDAGEGFVAVVGLVEPEALDHRPHRAIQHEDPTAGHRFERLPSLVAFSRHGLLLRAVSSLTSASCVPPVPQTKKPRR